MLESHSQTQLVIVYSSPSSARFFLMLFPKELFILQDIHCPSIPNKCDKLVKFALYINAGKKFRDNEACASKICL